MNDRKQRYNLGAEQQRELMLAAQAGDAEARELLISSNTPLYISLLRKLCKVPRELEADMLQEAYLAACQSIDTYNGTTKPSTWMSNCVVNHCRDMAKEMQCALTGAVNASRLRNLDYDARRLMNCNLARPSTLKVGPNITPEPDNDHGTLATDVGGMRVADARPVDEVYDQQQAVARLRDDSEVVLKGMLAHHQIIIRRTVLSDESAAEVARELRITPRAVHFVRRQFLQRLIQHLKVDVTPKEVHERMGFSSSGAIARHRGKHE